jgi:ArsR family transcriptional regulator
MQADICKAFADPKRLFIIKELAQGERSVGELAGKLGVRSANVSQHLAILRDRGVVEARREGTTLFYYLTNPRIADACHLVRQILLDQIKKTGALTSGL